MNNIDSTNSLGHDFEMLVCSGLRDSIQYTVFSVVKKINVFKQKSPDLKISLVTYKRSETLPVTLTR